MVLATGTYWKAEYGEISDNLEFRIGYIGQDSWDAYFPIGQLSDLIAVLNGVTPLSAGGLYQGSQLQARKVPTGFKVFVSVEPKSNLYPVQIVRFEDSLTSDLISTLTSLQSLISSGKPSPWDIPESNDVLFNLVVAEAVAARDAAQAAQAGAEAVGSTNDGIIAAQISDSSSATNAALSAAFVSAEVGADGSITLYQNGVAL